MGAGDSGTGSEPDRPRHVVVTGMMAVGKTTVGRALARRLGVAYADNDDALRAAAGVDAASFALEHGIDALHELEHDILAAAVARADGAVVGAPGSVALDPGAGAVLHGQIVVWLRARVDTLAERVRHDPARPLIGPDVPGTLTRLMAERDPGFARLATVEEWVDGRSVDELTGAILRRSGITS